MKAMVLAAGMGTRLGVLTADRPKALVEVAGRSLLEITLTRLRSFGVREVVINVHHYSGLIVDYLKSHGKFGMNIHLSVEEQLLDTGGALKRAARYLLGPEGREQEPFLLHNVDVISSIDLDGMARFHRENQALATLAVQNRQTSRCLLFDQSGELSGRQRAEGLPAMLVRAADQLQALGFCGVHVISSRLLTAMKGKDRFSIIDFYLEQAAAGERILAFPANGCYWRDMGTPAAIAEATEDWKHGTLPL